MMKLVKSSLFVFLFLGCTSLQAQDPLPTVEKVELAAYTGKWYEVSRLPNRFQKKCIKSTAEYGVVNSETVSVLNTCYKKEGKVSTIKGKAKVTNAPSNSKLLVKFSTWYSFLIPKGKYWILSLVENKNNTYELSLVGTPDRKFLWILSRSPVPSKAAIDSLKVIAQDYGFDTSKMIDSF